MTAKRKQSNLLIRNCDFFVDPMLAALMTEQQIHDACTRLVYVKFRGTGVDVVENKRFRLSQTAGGTYELREEYGH